MHAAKYSARALGAVNGVALDNQLRGWLLDGSHGVDLFFVISGFCLTFPFLHSLRAEGEGRLDLVEYMTHRIVRIVPPYYAAMAIFSGLIIVLTSLGMTLPFGAMSWPTNALDSARQLLFWDGSGGFVNGSFWTLAVEWRWYFVMPLLLFVWTRNQRAFWAIAFVAFILYHATLFHIIDVATLPAFMLGIVAAQIAVEGGGKWTRYALLGAVGCIAAAIVTSRLTGDAAVYQDQLFWQLASFCFVVASNTGVLRTALSWAPLAFVGVASYSIYLVHEPIIALVEQRTSVGPVIAGLIALLAGVAFWAIFERPVVSGAARDALRRFVRPGVRTLVAWLRLQPDIVASSASIRSLPAIVKANGSDPSLSSAHVDG